MPKQFASKLILSGLRPISYICMSFYVFACFCIKLLRFYYVAEYRSILFMTNAVRMPRGLPRRNLASSGSRASELVERRPLVKHGV